MMKRDECLKILARHRQDKIVVAVYNAAQEWIHISPSDLNFTFIGAMGQGSSMGLGIALGRPDRRVIILDGDGSLLMNLGSLVTIGHAAPKNLIHCVCENGIYETVGGTPIPGAGQISFTGIARAAGYRKTYEYDNIQDWEREAAEVIDAEGPVMISLKMVKGENYPEDFRRLYGTQYREAFRRALASQPPGFLPSRL